MRTRLLPLFLVLAITACRDVETIDEPTTPPILTSDLSSDEGPRSRLDDFWTRELKEYMTPEELDDYYQIPLEKRGEEYFAGKGHRFLEFCLREDLLEEHRGKLQPEHIEELRSKHDFDSTEERLTQILEERTGP